MGQESRYGKLNQDLRDLRGDQDGAVAVILVAVLAGLLGLAGLAFDFGRAWIVQTDLQAAVDAAALAGATQLDGQAGARRRAVLAASGGVARNDRTFTHRLAGGAAAFDTGFACQVDGCAMTNGSFRFLSSLAPRADALSDTEARFVEVGATQTLRFVLTGLLGAQGGVSPRASAVASWDRYVCGRAALLMCNPDEPPGNLRLGAVFDPAPHFGKGLTLRTGSAPGPGTMAWLAAVTCDPATDSCGVATDSATLADGLGQVLPTQSCLAQAPVSPVATSSLAAAINTRLDIYSGFGPSSDPAFQPSPNFLSGLIPQAGAVAGGTLLACDFPGALVAAAQPFLGPGRHPPLGAEPLDHVGYPRDNCAYPHANGSAPADSCIAAPPAGSGLAAGRALGSGVWDLPAYMAHHHAAFDPTGWSFNLCPAGACRLGADDTVDRDGDGRLSRWEVYVWELGGPAPDFGRPRCFGGGAATLPQPPANSPRAVDRRLLGALVANCEAIAARFGAAALTGNQDLPLAGGASTLALFLSEAVGELAPDALYVEIVDPGAVAGAHPVVSRDRVVLRE